MDIMKPIVFIKGKTKNFLIKKKGQKNKEDVILDLSQATISELKKFAKEQGINLHGAKNKKNILKEIKKVMN